MRGMTEIFVSITLVTASIGTFTYLKKEIKSPARVQNESEPVQAAYQSDSPGINEDSRMSLNWGLEMIESAGMAGRKPATVNKKITIAIIDTGADINHPQLTSGIWMNPGETGPDEFGNDKATNGIDDDDNGFVDDVHGWNFASSSGAVMDEHGHGTHIAGIIEAVSPGASLMILKYYDRDSDGISNLENTIRSIRYAVRMGADIINYSGGGTLRSAAEEEALKWAAEQGVLVVAAAGNEGMNSDFMHFYPADYDLPNILSVTAVDREGELMGISNFGLNTVDIAAPGKAIYSTLPNGQYGFMTGTSQATAFATGIAAALMTRDFAVRQPAEIIRHLTENGLSKRNLKTKVRSGMIANARKSLEALDVQLAQAVGNR